LKQKGRRLAFCLLKKKNPGRESGQSDVFTSKVSL